MGLRQYELRSHVIAEGINQSVRNESNIFLIELSTKKGPKFWLMLKTPQFFNQSEQGLCFLSDKY